MPKISLQRAEAALRRHAMAYPETTEAFPWGHPTYKVRGKAFVFLSNEEDGLGLSVKLPASGAAALTLPFTEPTHYGLGRSGWVTARFAPGADVPIDLLQEWIDESWRAVAPNKLVASTSPTSAESERAKPAARSRSAAKAGAPKGTTRKAPAGRKPRPAGKSSKR